MTALTQPTSAGPPARPRSHVRLLVAVLAAIVLVGAWVTTRLPARATVPAPSGWTLVFSDDFNGAASTGVNTANWLYTTGTSYPGGPANFGTGEVETMTASTANVYQDGTGNLRIRPLRDAAGNWTSGRIETQRSDFQPPAGGKLRVESRLQMPNVTGSAAAGYWPAFWMLGAPYRGNWWNWPSVGELDIMENVQGLNNVWATMHCGVAPGGPCNEYSGIGGQRACSGTTCQAGFHTYTMEWDRSVSPEQMRFYLDGVQFHSVSANQVDSTTWTNATNHGFFIILNVAMGGSFPAAFGGGPTADTVSGVPLVVDYVAVWQAGGGSTPPPSSAAPAPTCGSLISQGRPTAASSVEAASLASLYAVDGNTGTRWSSAFSDPQWIQVDLGSTRAISRVRLNWEAAYGRSYQIQTSTDGVGWANVYATTNGDGGIDDLGISANARYVRMYGTQRATPYGYSLWEFQVYGGCGSTSPPPTSGSRDAYSLIQAESYNQHNGVTVEATTDTGGGQNIASIANGDWTLYQNVDFGSTAATQFYARVASGAAGGVSGLVEVRLESPTGAVLGSFAIANTGGWQTWRTVPANIGSVTGVHGVYLTFTSGQPANFVNVNWIQFGH